MGPSSGKPKNKSGYNSPLPPHPSLQLLKWVGFLWQFKAKKKQENFEKIVISTTINFSLFWNSFCCLYM